MTCQNFKPIALCKSCTEEACKINGGAISPCEMCGCDFCANQVIKGDTEKCLFTDDVIK